MNNVNTSILRGNKLELHYWFNDDSHTMDAFIQNKCEFEFLKVIKEVSEYIKIDIVILTEPLENGGLKRTFQLIEKNAKEYPFLALVIIGLFGFPAKEFGTHIFNKLFEDKEFIELQKENLRKQNRNLDLEYNELSNRNSIKKKISNYYDTLNKESKVEKVSYQLKDESNIPVSKEYVVPKNRFKDFILPSNDLEPIELEEQIIEIISPDLKGGRYKWKGIYNNEIVAFSMNSKEFNRQIKQGKIEFKNGSSIKCDIDIQKMLDEEGNEKVKNIIVVRVLEYFENDKPIETPEGKKKRRQKEAEKNILKFDFGDEYN